MLTMRLAAARPLMPVCVRFIPHHPADLMVLTQDGQMFLPLTRV